MDRRTFIGILAGGLLAAPPVVGAQPAGKVPRIGYIDGASSSTNPELTDAFRDQMRQLGYVEGKNLVIEYRWADGKYDRLPDLAADLVRLRVDVIVTVGDPVILAAKEATTTIPIVMASVGDPVGRGFVASLARPGGNITGVTRLTRDLSGKRLELLKEVVPRISRVGLLSVTGPDVRGNALKEYEAAARALKIPFQALEVSAANPDLEDAFQAAAKSRISAVVTSRNFVLVPYRKKIADLAIKNRLPSMYELKSYVEAGGLMSYTADETESYRRAAVYVDKILKGAKPAELPIEQPTKFELVINLKTAKQIGVTIPQWVLVKADKVIK